MTLAQIIERHEATQAAPLDVMPLAVGLTPRGDATVAIYRLTRQMQALNPEDRAWTVELLNALMVDLRGTTHTA